MDTNALPLAGVRVLALEQAVAAPLCSRHLADLGADVIKIEQPGGEFARRYDGVVNGQATYFVWLNAGKRSVVLDLKQDEDRHSFEALLATADVFLHNFGPGAVDRLGFDWPTLHARWPGLVNCAISGYGPDGPYRDRKAFDLLLQGESGVTSITGSPEAAAKVGISIADIGAGMYALSAILAALFERSRTGLGRSIDISMLECLAEWMTAPAYFQIFRGQAPLRTGLHHNTIVPYGPYPARDGKPVNLAVQNDGQWQRLCVHVLQLPELQHDPRFATNDLRLRNRRELEPTIERVLSDLPADEVARRLDLADVPYGSVNDLADLVDHPQLRARGRWATVETASGPVPALEHPFNFRGISRPLRAVPQTGQHTSEVLGELSTRDDL